MNYEGQALSVEASVDNMDVKSKTDSKAKPMKSGVKLAALEDVEHIVQAQGATPNKIGINIAARNPDVEIAALVMKDVPVTMDSFRELASGNDWYCFSFVVLQVGPAGFSTVSYTSTEKKSEKEEGGLPLYEGFIQGEPCMAPPVCSFWNMNGMMQEPMHEDEGQGGPQMQSVSVTMQPGQCMAHFLRSDDFNGKFFVDNAETLSAMRVVPAYNVVYFQVSSANVEQAKHGRMLKFKKMKVVSSKKEELAVLHASLPYLHMNREEFNAANEPHCGSEAITICDVSKEAFVTDDEPAAQYA